MASKIYDAVRSFFVDDSPPGFASGRSWEDRLREAAYNSPSGKRIPFVYEDVSTEIDLRNAVFEFPSLDGGYVQPNGHGPRRYPLRVFFWGPDHDILASGFVDALLEPGTGQLEHPIYGQHTVVPVGTITRRDDLKSAANQSVIEVAFWRSLTDLYPISATNPEGAVVAAADAFDAALAAQLASDTDLITTIAKANASNTVLDYVAKAGAYMRKIAETNSAAIQDFRAAEGLLNRGIDTLIGEPLLLAQQVSNMITAPARATSGIRDRLEGYQNFYASLVASSSGDGADDAPQSGPDSTTAELRRSNDFHITDLFALAAIGGSARSAAGHVFTTRPEAIEAAESVVAQLDAAVAWRETRYGALEQIDTGEAIQALQDTVGLVTSYLVQVSFSLVPERRVVLDRARTIVDLAAELYGSVDDKLDFLIQSNNLTGSEILEVPRGRTIAYYP